MKNRKMILFSVAIILIIILYLFFGNNMAKNLKFGNNTSSQEIVKSILNTSSYKTEIEVKVKSNKNENRYRMKQIYNGNNENEQEVIEPENISGVKITRKGNTLIIENTELKLSTIFENYEYISDNNLDLYCFIEDYKKNEKSNFKENEKEIIMKTNNGEKNKTEKKLYINKENGKPTKMEISDNSKNIAVYILYKEVILNS